MLDSACLPAPASVCLSLCYVFICLFIHLYLLSASLHLLMYLFVSLSDLLLPLSLVLYISSNSPHLESSLLAYLPSYFLPFLIHTSLTLLLCSASLCSRAKRLLLTAQAGGASEDPALHLMTARACLGLGTHCEPCVTMIDCTGLK
jgi:hypothetical protein